MTEIAASDAAMRAAASAWTRARIYDDKLGEPDSARIAAWAESVERWKLSTPDLLEGVIRYYEGETHGRILGIGDLLHHAREARRQRAERETAQQIHASALPAGSAGSGWAGLPINAAGRPVWDAYDVNDAIERTCPRCAALPGDACVSSSQQPQRIPCLPRMARCAPGRPA